MSKKIRVAILCGYNGINFWGSQKNNDVRSVEEELEKGLFALKMISEFNFGDLKKIGWGRATRTDKRVHALQNTFSAKVLVAKRPFVTVRDENGKVVEYRQNCGLDDHLEELRVDLNKVLPSDVKVFSMFLVSNRFNAKNCTSNREYSYFLPTFMLTPISELYLATPPRQMTEEEQKQEETKQ